MTKYREKYEGKYKDIISDWGNKSDCEEFEIKIDKWLSQFESNDREVALRLLSKFQMYRRIYLENKIKELYVRLQKHLKGEKVNSFFMLLNATDRLANSSFFAFECKKTLKDVTIHQDLKLLTDDEIDLLDNKIVLIDDYVGTGQSFIKTIKYLINEHPKMKEFQFLLLVVNISELGKQNIQEFLNINHLRIKLAYCDLSSKAFKEKYIFDTNEFESIRNRYKELCDTLHIDMPFGYQETEALIAFDTCIPNNNIATFRSEGYYEDKNVTPLFKREANFKDAISKLRERKVLTRRLNSYSKVEDIFNFRTQLFVLYCVLQGKKLEASKICRLFGFTNSQFNDKLNFVIINKLLVQAGEKFETGPSFYNSFRNKSIVNKIIKNILDGEIRVDEKEFCDIINYTPVDFENRFKGYLGS